MTRYFNGNKYALEKEEILKKKVNEIKKKGITPKLTSIIVGDDPGSILYQNLKKKAAERVGAELEIISLSSSLSLREIQEVTNKLNADKSVNGIMVQLPLPDNFSRADRNKIICTINKEKDVDGLRQDSPFLHPTSKAVLEVLGYALSILQLPNKLPPYVVCVVGATGMVGVPLVRELKRKRLVYRHSGTVRNLHLEVLEADSKTENLVDLTKRSDILIGCSGISGIIKKDMVKEGVILLDVGAPVGDIERGAYEKAAFVSPVPGGIGPVTIVCLMENLLESQNNEKIL